MNDIVIRQTADSNVREYHLDQQLSEVPYAQVLDSEMSSSTNFDKLGGDAAAVLKALNGTKGIIKLTIRPHSLKVYKEPSVSWSQVEPGVLSAFEKTYGTAKTTHFTKATRTKQFA